MPRRCCPSTAPSASTQPLQPVSHTDSGAPPVDSSGRSTLRPCSGGGTACGDSFCSASKGVCTSSCTCEGEATHASTHQPCGTLCCRYWHHRTTRTPESNQIPTRLVRSPLALARHSLLIRYHTFRLVRAQTGRRITALRAVAAHRGALSSSTTASCNGQSSFSIVKPFSRLQRPLGICVYSLHFTSKGTGPIQIGYSIPVHSTSHCLSV